MLKNGAPPNIDQKAPPCKGLSSRWARTTASAEQDVQVSSGRGAVIRQHHALYTLPRYA